MKQRERAMLGTARIVFGRTSHTPEEEFLVEKILAAENFYKLLEIANNATIQDIKVAYNKIVVNVHPSTNRYSKAKEAQSAVRKAAAVLLHTDTRQAYDVYLQSGCVLPNDNFHPSDETAMAKLKAAGMRSVMGEKEGIWGLYEMFHLT